MENWPRSRRAVFATVHITRHSESYFLDEMAIKSMRVFESQKAAFNEADVLQENVILRAVKTRIKPQTVMIFASSGQSDDMVAYHETRYEKIVLPDDAQRFIRIVEDSVDDKVQQRLQSLPSRLDHMGLSASTGRVVDFRATDLLQAESCPFGNCASA